MQVLQEDMSCTCSGEVRTLLREQLQSEEGGLASMGQVDTIFEEVCLLSMIASVVVVVGFHSSGDTGCGCVGARTKNVS